MDNETTTVSITFTISELNLVLAALGKQPWEAVNAIVNKIVTDAQNQIPAAQAGDDET
jgi:hypothetical protein